MIILRILKWLALGIVGIIALAAATIGIIWWKGPAKREVTEVRFPSTPERIAHGKYVAEHVAGCTLCHSEQADDVWSRPAKPGTEGMGGCWPEEEGGFGKICSPNITPHPTAGIGSWTDDQLARAIREQINKDGRPLLSMHRAFHDMSDEDVQAVVVYLRSLPPSDKVVPRSEVDFPSRFLSSMVFPGGPEPVLHPIHAPDRKDSVAYGKYLVGLADCVMCHTPRDGFAPAEGKEFSGGQVFKGVVRSANLTPDATGLGERSREDFIGMFRAYSTPEGAQIPADPHRNTSMPWVMLSGMTDEDLGSIYDYLRTVKPVRNVGEKFVSSPTP